MTAQPKVSEMAIDVQAGRSATAEPDTARQRRRLVLGGVLGFLAFAAVSLVITKVKGHPHVELDPLFGIPPHPKVAAAPYEVSKEVGVSIVMTTIGLIGVVLGLVSGVRNRTVLPVAIALSAAAIVVPEVFYDVVGGVYFPFSDVETFGSVFHILGRTMPVWIITGWFGYGVFCFGTWAVLSSRPTTRLLWLAWGGAILGDIVFEEVLLKFDVYHYYGNQPLVLISELPWWWIPCNSVGVILAASLIYRFRSSLQGWRALACFVITPMSVTGVYGFIALPSWIAVNSDMAWLPTQLLGLSTIVLGIFAFMGVLKLVLNRDPFALDYKPSSEVDEFSVVR